MSELLPVMPLVRSASAQLRVRKWTAFALAHLHDTNSGHIAISMQALADMSGGSKAQVRKHVHSMIACGVLEITANAHGGAPGAVPHYRFNRLRLEAMAKRPGQTPDIFDSFEEAEPSYRFTSEGRARMVAQLTGQPGRRRLRFYREAQEGLRDYGEVALSDVLKPWRMDEGWDAVLYPTVELEDDYPEEIFPGEFEKLQQWAQATALGRTESVVSA